MGEMETGTAAVLSAHREKINDVWRSQLILQSREMVESLGVKNVEILSAEIMDAMIQALPHGDDINSAAYDKIKENLGTVSKTLSQSNFTPSETCIFIFSLKDAVLPVFQQENNTDETLADQIQDS